MRVRELARLIGLLILWIHPRGCHGTPKPLQGISPKGIPPNIIVIMADDLGFGDVGFHGFNPNLRTPNIDRLAKEGVVLRNYFTHPMCMPSRAAFMTGRYPWSFGLTREPANWPIPKDAPLLPELLFESGYNTSIIGKWDLNMERNGHYQGFFGFEHSRHFFAGRYYNNIIYTNSYLHDKPNEYLTTYMGKEAVKFIEAQQDPYFLWLAFFAPHKPWEAPGEYVEQFSHIEDPGEKIYAAVIKAMDDEIGRVVEALDRLGQRENTLIIFTSDNGGVYSPGVNNGNYRGWKLSAYDGGIRVPAVVNWPSQLQPGVLHESVTIEDLYDTVLNVAQVTPRESVPYRRNIMPLLGPPHVVPHEEPFPPVAPLAGADDRPIFHDLSSYSSAVRRGRYKLVIVAKGCVPRGGAREASLFPYNHAVTKSDHLLRMYDVVEDPGELNNLLVRKYEGAYTEIKKELLKLYLTEATKLEAFFSLVEDEDIRQQTIPNLFCWNHQRVMEPIGSPWQIKYHSMELAVVSAHSYHSCSPYVRKIKKDLPLAYWMFQKALGPGFDSSGNGNSLVTPEGHHIVSLPRPGFPTNTAMIPSPVSLSYSKQAFTLGNTFTLEIVFMFSTPGNSEILGLAPNPKASLLTFSLGVDESYLRVSFLSQSLTFPTRTLETKQLHHVALVRKGGVFKIYHNGDYISSGEFPDDAEFGTRHFAVVGRQFPELLDEISIFDRDFEGPQIHLRYDLLREKCKTVPWWEKIEEPVETTWIQTMLSLEVAVSFLVTGGLMRMYLKKR